MKARPKLAPVSEEMKQWSALLAKELASWPGVTSRPMFGMTGFYRKGRIFAVLPRTRALGTPNSVAFKIHRETPKILKQLAADLRIRATRHKPAGWIGFELRTAADLKDALKWLDLAYTNCSSRNNSKT